MNTNNTSASLFSFFNIVATCCLSGLIFLSSCTRESAEQKEWARLDSLCLHHPEEALRQIEILDKEGGDTYQQQRRSLLRYEAEDKCDIRHTDESDLRLITDIHDYFEQHGSPTDRLTACYYMGRTYRDRGDDGKALDWFLRADQIAEKLMDENASTSTKIVWAFICSQLSNIYRNQEDYRSAYDRMRQSMALAESAGMAGFTFYEDMARAAKDVDSIDMATDLYKRSAQDLLNKGLVSRYSALLGEQIAFYSETENRVLADWAKSLLQSLNPDSLASNVYSALGSYYERIKEDNDSALFYEMKAFERERRVFVRAHLAKRIAAQYRSKGETSKELEYLRIFSTLQDSTENLMTARKEIRAKMQRYQQQKLENAQKEASHQRHLFSLSSVAVVTIAMLAFAAIFFLCRKERDKRQEKLITEMPSSDSGPGSSTYDAKKAELLDRLEAIAKDKEKELDHRLWPEIFLTVDRLYPSFSVELERSHGAMKEKDRLLHYLTKLGLSQKSIAGLFNTSPSTVSRRLH